MQQPSFFSEEELASIGFKSYGTHVLISRFARFYAPQLMEFGNHVRIDDFCILSGDIKLGSYIHISAFCALYGKFGIELMDYSGLSPRCTVFSASDDFSGEYMIGPMLPNELTQVTGGKVTFEKYTQMGANTVVLPDVIIKEGSVTGAMSLVNKSLDSWGIYAGIPAKLIKPRKKGLSSLSQKISK
jgi:acetyltransferase-like isoleucine patch superfamily enzyme